MKIIIKADVTEIAALAAAQQARQSADPDVLQYLKDRRKALDKVQSRSSGPPMET